MASLGTTLKKLDIRDIKGEVIYPGITAFEDLFKLQKVLLDHYTKIESLPMYPIDINSKTSQSLIKDFSGRIIEELGEAYESYAEMLKMFHKGIPEKDMVPFLQNFNEEVADALHFWLELMIYSGFEIETIKEWLLAEPLKSNKEFAYDPLEASLEFVKILNNSEDGFKRYIVRYVIKDDEVKDEFLMGGRRISQEINNKMRILLWDTTYWLQLCRNTLKNKPWKQTQMMTDENLYGVYMKKVFISLFKFLEFSGFTKESIYTIYYKKNRVNLFRIKSKY